MESLARYAYAPKRCRSIYRSTIDMQFRSCNGIVSSTHHHLSQLEPNNPLVSKTFAERTPLHAPFERLLDDRAGQADHQRNDKPALMVEIVHHTEEACCVGTEQQLQDVRNIKQPDTIVQPSTSQKIESQSTVDAILTASVTCRHHARRSSFEPVPNAEGCMNTKGASFRGGGYKVIKMQAWNQPKKRLYTSKRCRVGRGTPRVLLRHGRYTGMGDTHPRGAGFAHHGFN